MADANSTIASRCCCWDEFSGINSAAVGTSFVGRKIPVVATTGPRCLLGNRHAPYMQRAARRLQEGKAHLDLMKGQCHNNCSYC